MTEHKIDYYISRMLQSNLAEWNTIIGCSEEEILNLEERFNIKFPAIYRAFLGKMGKSAGIIFGNDNLFYDDLLEINYEWRQEINHKEDIRDLKNIFIIREVEGGLTLFFILPIFEEDPPIYGIQTNKNGFTKKFDHFSNMIFQDIESSELAYYFGLIRDRLLQNKSIEIEELSIKCIGQFDFFFNIYLNGFFKREIIQNDHFLRRIPEIIEDIPFQSYKGYYLKLNPNQDISKINKQLQKKRDIEILNLDFYTHKEMPKELMNLIHLKELYISRSNLCEIHQEIGQLKNLKNMYIHENKLFKLPNSIGELKSLQILDASYNQINELPASIGALKKLKFISLACNPLLNLPETIGELTSLEVLYLNRCKLENIPTKIGNLFNLICLNCNGNWLQSLPTSIGQLIHLKELHLEHNCLKELPDCFQEMKALEILQVGGNDLITLPKSITLLSKLKLLDLVGNQIDNLSGPEWDAFRAKNPPCEIRISIRS